MNKVEREKNPIHFNSRIQTQNWTLAHWCALTKDVSHCYCSVYHAVQNARVKMQSYTFVPFGRGMGVMRMYACILAIDIGIGIANSSLLRFSSVFLHFLFWLSRRWCCRFDGLRRNAYVKRHISIFYMFATRMRVYRMKIIQCISLLFVRCFLASYESCASKTHARMFIQFTLQCTIKCIYRRITIIRRLTGQTMEWQ